MTDAAATLLKGFLNSIHPLGDEAMADMLSTWNTKDFRRKECITQEGQTERYLYFVLEGVQRSYYIKDGKEHVIAFTYPPSFSGIPESFITQTPSLYFLECITPSKMLRISHDNVQRLMDDHRDIERLFRKATEYVLAGFIHRHYELLACSIEERFRLFVKRSPHLLTMVPHKHLASYLGIDPTNFSKLLGSVRL